MRCVIARFPFNLLKTEVLECDEGHQTRTRHR